MIFRTTIVQGPKSATGIVIPPEIVEALGAGKRPPVRVAIAGYTYRSTVAVMGGNYMVGVSAEVRAASGVAGGDTIDVDLTLDRDVREVTVPPELQEALDRNPAAKNAFDALSNSAKQRWTLPVQNAKTAETRTRNIEKALRGLAP